MANRPPKLGGAECHGDLLEPQQLTKCYAEANHRSVPLNEGATRQPVASGAGSVRDGGEG